MEKRGGDLVVCSALRPPRGRKQKGSCRERALERERESERAAERCVSVCVVGIDDVRGEGGGGGADEKEEIHSWEEE